MQVERAIAPRPPLAERFLSEAGFDRRKSRGLQGAGSPQAFPFGGTGGGREPGGAAGRWPIALSIKLPSERGQPRPSGWDQRGRAMRAIEGEESEPVGAAVALAARRRQGKQARGCSLLAKWGCGGGVLAPAFCPQGPKSEGVPCGLLLRRTFLGAGWSRWQCYLPQRWVGRKAVRARAGLTPGKPLRHEVPPRGQDSLCILTSNSIATTRERSPDSLAHSRSGDVAEGNSPRTKRPAWRS